MNLRRTKIAIISLDGSNLFFCFLHHNKVCYSLFSINDYQRSETADGMFCKRFCSDPGDAPTSQAKHRLDESQPEMIIHASLKGCKCMDISEDGRFCFNL